MMRVEEIVQGLGVCDRRGRLDVDVESIVFDSRKAGPDTLFVAVKGTKADGHAFIPQAVERGVRAVMAERWPDGADREDRRPQVVLVPDSHRALALAAANFYGQPSRKLLMAGVTGTNGKTTTTYVLESIFRGAARRVGLIGTTGYRMNGEMIPLDHTTPDPVLLQALLRKMVDYGVTHVAMEVSSHALEQQRVAGVHFKVAGFTNLTQDHLDYHKDLEAYFQAKAKLFSDVLRRSRARGRMAVVNVDDPRGAELISVWGGKSLKVSCRPDADADVVALEASYSLDHTSAKVRTPKGVWDLQFPLVGAHNLSNVLLAVGMALAMGFSRARVFRGLERLEGVPGRLEAVTGGTEPKRVFVDYAHTPDALERVLSALRPLTKGRLVVVFGCGGDRDRGKRPKMGEIVARLADLAIVTSDNPRNEDPAQIAAEIEPGLQAGGFTRGAALEPRRYVVELDRRGAIRLATRTAAADDVVLIAGKGHETTQTIGRQVIAFDDREETRRILAGLPPPPPEIRELDAPAEELIEEVELEEIATVQKEVTSEVDVADVVEEEDAKSSSVKLRVEVPSGGGEGA